MQDRSKELEITLVDLQESLQKENWNQKQLSNEDFSGQIDSLKQAMLIASRYTDASALYTAQPQVILADAVQLGALIVPISELAGSLAGRAQQHEQEYKLVRSKIYLRAKELKQRAEAEGKRSRITEKDIEALSRTISEDSLLAMTKEASQAERVRYLYYSLKSLSDQLDSAAGRILQAEMSDARRR